MRRPTSSAEPSPICPRFTLTIHSAGFVVAVADFGRLDGLSVDQRAHEGLTVIGRGLVLINEDVTDRRRAVVFWHELVHGLLGEIQSARAALFRCTEDVVDDAEEDLASTFGPALGATLPSAGVTRALAGAIGTGPTGALPTLAELLAEKPRGVRKARSR